MIDETVLKNEERAIFALRSLYRGFGYRPFKMSKFEEYDLYVKNKDFLVSDRVITFNDISGKLLALKPDVTLSIIKNTAEDSKTKVYYNENVYRVSGSTGNFKEIMQAGLECIGDIDINDVYESLFLAAKSLETVSRDYVLDISHMGLLSAILDLGSRDEMFKRQLTALIAEKNGHEARAICEKYYVPAEITELICSLTSTYGDIDSVIDSFKDLPLSENGIKALSELRIISDLLSEDEFSGKVRFDFSVVNNMNYYDGIVFSGFISGIFEAVLSGGQYGKILASMDRGGDAVGFALYLDLLSDLDDRASDHDVDVLLLYDSSVSASVVEAEKKRIASTGKSVLSHRSIPKKIRYREVVELKGGSDNA